MKVLCYEDCQKINEVVEHILAHPNDPVWSVKKKFNLSKDEYDMISELMMPALRQKNNAHELKVKIGSILRNMQMEKERFEDARNQQNAVSDQSGDNSVRRVQVGA